MKLSNMAKVVTAVIICAAMAGCGGGSSSNPATTKGGSGRVSYTVQFPGRPADRSVAQTGNTVEVTVSISGYYDVDGSQFAPVSAAAKIDASTGSGYGTVSVLDVPIGRNHVLTATAKWSDGYTQTVKAIVPEVESGQTTTVSANPFSTAVAGVAIGYSTESGVRLPDISDEMMEDIYSATAYILYQNGGSYDAITGPAVKSYLTPQTVSISPTAATVQTGGTQQFTITVLNSVEQPLAAHTVTVSNSIGTINADGLFTAASVAGEGTITLTAYGKTASASVKVLSATTASGCSSAALQYVSSAKALLFQPTLSETDFNTSKTQVASALAASPSCPDALMLSAIQDIASEGNRVATTVLTTPEQLFPLNNEYHLSGTLERVVTPVTRNLPRVANTLDDTSDPSEIQTEVQNNLLGVLNGALAKLVSASAVTATDAAWSFSIPKDPANPTLGNDTLDRNDLTLLTGSLQFLIGSVYLTLAFNMDLPVDYATTDPCPETIMVYNPSTNAYTTSTDTSYESLMSDNICVAADVNEDNTLTPTEYLPPSPYGTLRTNGATYLQNFVSNSSAGLTLINTAVESILAESTASAGGQTIATTLLSDINYYKHYVSELAASFGGTVTNITIPGHSDCWLPMTFDGMTYYYPSERNDKDLQSDPGTSCAALIVSEDDKTLGMKLSALASLTNFRDIMPTYSISANTTGGGSSVEFNPTSSFIGTTLGGVVPAGVPKSFFNYREAYALLQFGQVVDTSGSPVTLLPGNTLARIIGGSRSVMQMTPTDYGITLSDGTNTLNASYVYCGAPYGCMISFSVSDSVPTAADYLTYNDWFGATMTLTFTGYAPITLTMYDYYYEAPTLTLTPTAL